MKNLSYTLSLFIILIGLSACSDKYTETYRANVPQYLSLESWRATDIIAETPRELNDPGKIYIYQNYLFIVEKTVGIHVFDNSTPSAPQNIAFLSIPGCVDLAVSNNLLYADSFYDLLVFDISDVANPILACRVEDVFDFDNWTLVNGFDENLPFAGIDPSKGIIVGWSQEDISQEINQEFYGYPVFEYDDLISIGSGAVNNISGSGFGGSMAQFTITNNFLYVLRPSSITSFDLSTGLCPQQSTVTAVSWNAETIFPYNNHLFLGTSSGMLIYDLNTPSTPAYVSEISHITACDPVAVQGNRAYVTIRTGTNCQGFTNGLMVVDISNYATPTLISEYDLTNPHGLGIDGNTLFICDGDAGLKVFDAEDDHTITDHLLAHYQNIQTYDVIPFNDVLIMSAQEGIYQYDYSNPQNITELSFIPAN